MQVSEARRLRALEEETRRLRGKSKFRFFRAVPGYSRVVLEGFYLRLQEPAVRSSDMNVR